jgi:hypothetical protein
MKDKYAPQKRYEKKNIVQFKIGLNRATDGDLIEWLEKQLNKSGLIKKLLRAEMRRGE